MNQTLKILVCYGCDCKPPHNLINSDFNSVSDLRVWHKDHETLHTRYSVSFSGNILDGDIVSLALGNWRIVALFSEQFYFSFFGF